MGIYGQIEEMKKRLIYSLLSIMIVGMYSCSKDDLIPQLSLSEGTPNYFVSSIDFDSHANEKSISFTSNVSWTASVDKTRDGSTWCIVSPNSGEAGSNVIKISVKENDTYDDRNAVVRLSYGDSIKSIYVNQKQLDALTLTSDRFEVPASGGEINVEVKANIKYQVNIADDSKSWIHQGTSSSTRALSSSNLVFKIDKSLEYETREGRIDIVSGDKKETIKVYQSGEGILSLTQKQFNLNNSEQDIRIEISSNFEYSVDMPDVDWISENGDKTRAVSTHTINLHISENTSYDDRSASIRIYDNNSDLSEEVVINQSQLNALQLDAKEFSFDENGGSFTVNINSNINYKIRIDGDWVKEVISQNTRALTSKSHHFSVAKMDGDYDREAKIIVSDSSTGLSDEIIVKQSRSLILEPSALSMMLDDTKQLKCTNKTGQELTWSSNNSEVVSVDNNGQVKALKRGTAVITVKTLDENHSYSCSITVKDITDCVTMRRTGTSSYISPLGSKYSVTVTISNTSSETIHIVSLAGVTNGVSQDLDGGSSISITLSSSSDYIQYISLKLIYTYKGKEYSLET